MAGRDNNRPHSIFTDFLTALGVPFTATYAVERFESMPFKSLFGMSKLLKEYGVESEGVKLASVADVVKLPVPFIAATAVGPVIVMQVGNGLLNYKSHGVPESMPLDDFISAWYGTAFLAYPSHDACEPDYSSHRLTELVRSMARCALWVCVAVLLVYSLWASGIVHSASLLAVAALDVAGLYVTWLLLQKTLNIHTRAAERVCGIIEQGGCDNVLKTGASKLFGVFSWSEVGFAYFSVSLLALLLYPGCARWLALCNLCCLPFSFWSVWYQKFRAKAWCTLCLTVQALLWLQFFCYLAGGVLKHAFPLGTGFFALGVVYVTVLLALNRVMPHFEAR